MRYAVLGVSMACVLLMAGVLVWGSRLSTRHHTAAVLGIMALSFACSGALIATS